MFPIAQPWTEKLAAMAGKTFLGRIVVVSSRPLRELAGSVGQLAPLCDDETRLTLTGMHMPKAQKLCDRFIRNGWTGVREGDLGLLWKGSRVRG